MIYEIYGKNLSPKVIPIKTMICRYYVVMKLVF